MNRLAFEPGSSIANRTGDWRSQQPIYRDKWPPCGQACPIAEDIQAWLALAVEDQWQAAWRKLTERNPLPAVMGRVCYHPCEPACNRAQLDGAVNIHTMERYLGDLALAQGWRHQPFSSELQDKRIAVIGSGPAGLSCAYQLARRGCRVTLFEAASEPGGLLRWGIPAYRLPKDVLAKEIQAIVELGVSLRLNTRVGREVNAATLQRDFDAVFVAVGAQQPRLDPVVSGHSVETGLEFLRRLNTGEPMDISRQLVVIGGGNTALDVARSARRLGASVTLVCPQDRHGSHPGQPAEEMPAIAGEVRAAEAEGVRLMTRWGVRRLVRNGQHLAGIEIAQVDHVHDAQGRFAPLLFVGTEQFIPAGRIILAIGQQADSTGIEELLSGNIPGVFVGGDAAGQSRLAAVAIGSGRQAAELIMAFWTGLPSQHRYRYSEVPFSALHPEYYSRQPRRETAHTPLDRRLQDFTEVVTGFGADDAAFEARRCLSCGVCFQCDNCWHFCPDAAVIKRDNDYAVDYDFCKGCGICAQECPCGHIDMEALSLDQ